MKDKLFNFYNERCTAKVLVYPYMKYLHGFLIWLFYLCIASLVLIIFFLPIALINIKWIIGPIIIFLVMVLPTYILFRVHEKKAARIIKKQFGLMDSPKNRHIILKEIKVHMISEYLIENDLYSKWKIEKLIEDYRKDNEAGKLPPLIAPGLLLAITIPNVSQFLNHVYGFYNTKENIPDLVKDVDKQGLALNGSLFLGIFFLSVGFVGAITVLNNIKNEIKEVVIYTKKPIRDNLIVVLEDVLYQMKEKTIEEKFIQSPPHRQ
ncbi:hypothetical protein [Paenibacillus sp. FSL H8-0259]|uniref:hypothetical protein n=1 Tax=Paenibacillus sp. FSL H8-0259 TaxID=1920423 RepID=UPI00096DD6A9|nr:hypothetical protein [Paenibacillus sp. FSL H8-0259]OMF30983.1 hypothetical protein BK132_06010 [Paenibacillus sp. FSL H8-0259]